MFDPIPDLDGIKLGIAGKNNLKKSKFHFHFKNKTFEILDIIAPACLSDFMHASTSASASASASMSE